MADVPLGRLTADVRRCRLTSAAGPAEGRRAAWPTDCRHAAGRAGPADGRHAPGTHLSTRTINSAADVSRVRIVSRDLLTVFRRSYAYDEKTRQHALLTAKNRLPMVFTG